MVTNHTRNHTTHVDAHLYLNLIALTVPPAHDLLAHVIGQANETHCLLYTHYVRRNANLASLYA
jgi:hypothetical protein